MDRWAGKVAVVTGASAGIGLATAQALLRKGMVVVGLARRKSIMEERMKGTKGKFYACECDVSDERNVINVFEWIKKNVGVVQVLVNNAGIANEGSLMDTSLKEWEKVIGVNVIGLLTCSKLAITMMNEADVEGHIVNINSITGHRVYTLPGAKPGIYPATKYAVTGITESLQKNVIGGKIKVTSISPGVVKTEIWSKFSAKEMMDQFPALQSEDIAEAVVYVIGTAPSVQVTELTIRPLQEQLMI